MATIIKNRQGVPVAITCPVCGKNKPIKDYQTVDGWADRCSKCKKDEWVLMYVDKPESASWDDVYMEPCVPHHGLCEGGKWTNRFENGKPVFTGQTCYACKGLGKQTYRDVLRNASYWEWDAYNVCMKDEQGDVMLTDKQMQQADTRCQVCGIKPLIINDGVCANCKDDPELVDAMNNHGQDEEKLDLGVDLGVF